MVLRNVGTIYRIARYYKVTVCMLFKDKLIKMSDGFSCMCKSVLVTTHFAVKLQYRSASGLSSQYGDISSR
jgi:hypothetical protein